jgi:hypothetical protein
VVIGVDVSRIEHLQLRIDFWLASHISSPRQYASTRRVELSNPILPALYRYIDPRIPSSPLGKARSAGTVRISLQDFGP